MPKNHVTIASAIGGSLRQNEEALRLWNELPSDDRSRICCLIENNLGHLNWSNFESRALLIDMRGAIIYQIRAAYSAKTKGE